MLHAREKKGGERARFAHVDCFSPLRNELILPKNPAKISLLLLIYEIIMVSSKYSILDFSLLFLVKLSLLILFAYFLVLVLCSLSKVIALLTIAISIVVALSRSSR